MHNQTTNEYLHLINLWPHMNKISARIAFNTTTLGVVILIQSYEESVNMSRCNFYRLNPLLNWTEMPSSALVHEFLIHEFADITNQPYNVMEIVFYGPSSIEESIINVVTF